ncbi:MAG: hypothetical protein Q3962_02795 [Corynebacterium sp.]|nr:hypothetical protein [Corynebacterium sp.]
MAKESQSPDSIIESLEQRIVDLESDLNEAHRIIGKQTQMLYAAQELIDKLQQLRAMEADKNNAEENASEE